MSKRRYFLYLTLMLVVLASAMTAMSQTSSTKRSAKKAVKPAAPKTHNSLTPTAEFASISGHVTTATGGAVPAAAVTVSGGALTEPTSVRVSATGDYRVDGLRAGATYIVTVRAKTYHFTNPSRPVTVLDDVTGVDFVAQP